jgi:hypothetical protein
LPEHDDLPVGRAVAGGHREARRELAVGKTNFWLRLARERGADPNDIEEVITRATTRRSAAG